MSIISEEHGRVISSQEAAQVLTRRAGGVRRYTATGINRMVSRGKLTPVMKIGGSSFFKPSDVELLHITPNRGQPSTRTRKGIGDTGITRAELAKRAHIAETSVWNAFHGNPITRETAAPLIQAFNAIRSERGQPTTTIEELGWRVKDVD